MSEVRFCYEIHADAGLANNTVTGENVKAYTEVKITFGRELKDNEYEQAHQKDVVELMAAQLGLNEEHIKPISVEEYLDNHDDDDVIKGGIRT